MTKKPKSYQDVEGPVLVDEWWAWSVMKALIATVPIGVGAILVALGFSAIGWVLIVSGPILYWISPDVIGPIAS